MVLVEMMRHLSEDIHLLIVGAGPEEMCLRQMADSFHVEQRVHFVSSVPYKELPRYMNCMDIGIVPSQTKSYWKEQFGRVLVEFMSCEVPVIGSNSGSIPEVLDGNGVLFQENNIQEVIQLVNMLRASPEKRYELAKYGRIKAESAYSIEKMSKQILTMYRRLLAL